MIRMTAEEKELFRYLQAHCQFEGKSIIDFILGVRRLYLKFWATAFLSLCISAANCYFLATRPMSALQHALTESGIILGIVPAFISIYATVRLLRARKMFLGMALGMIEMVNGDRERFVELVAAHATLPHHAS